MMSLIATESEVAGLRVNSLHAAPLSPGATWNYDVVALPGCAPFNRAATKRVPKPVYSGFTRIFL
jgi:hypothetical protein